MRNFILLMQIGLGVVLLCATVRAEAPAIAIGSKIEVREGDTWSTVTVERREGRKYYVRYDDGTEEWIGPDRIRNSGRGAATAPGAASPPPSPAPAGPVAASISLTDWSNIDTNGAALQVGRATGATVSIPTTRPAEEFNSLPIHPTVNDFNNRPERITDCVGNPNIAIVTCGILFRDAPEVIRLDLSTGQPMGSGFFQKRNQYVLSAADNGKVILTGTAMGWDSQLHLWALEGGNYKLKANYDPFDNGSPNGKLGDGLGMARLVDATHAIFSANSGETYLVDLQTNKATGMAMHTKDSRVYLHPSGRIMALLTDRGTAQIIRTSDFAAMAELPKAAAIGPLTIDPSGTTVAYPTDDQSLRIVKIADGSLLGVIPGIAGRDARVELVAPDKVFCNDGTVFDVKSALPLWIYKYQGVDDPPRLLANGQLLMLNKSFEAVTAISVTLPDKDGTAAAASLTTASFDLTPGAKMYVGGDLSVFGSEEAEARKVITDRLTASRFNVVQDAASPIQVLISAQAGPREQRVYKFPSEPEPRIAVIRSTIVTVSVVVNKAAVFQQEFRFAAGNPLRITREGQTLQEAADEAALPRAGQMAGLNIPSYVVHGAVPGSPAALGSSEITPRGVVPSPRPLPPPAPPTTPLPPPVPATPQPKPPAGKAV